MIKTEYLEIHVAHTCNLYCSSCSHYSQHHLGGIVSLEQVQDWTLKWNSRLYPEEIMLLGGEPTIHPKLPEFIEWIKQAWPGSKLTLKTNGFFLERHARLREVLFKTGAMLEINCHSDHPDYIAQYRKIMAHVEDWVEIPIVLKNSFGGAAYKEWTLRYLGQGAQMKPFTDKAPKKSWSICVARNCLTLFEGRLWKCPPIAYLRILPRYLTLSNEWSPYLAYQGLAADCSDSELQEFLARKEENICGMCPSKEIALDKGNPLKNSAKISSGCV
jgi:hypothetical protein